MEDIERRRLQVEIDKMLIETVILSKEARWFTLIKVGGIVAAILGAGAALGAIFTKTFF